MSLLGNIGSEAAAKDIADFIRQRIEAVKSEQRVMHTRRATVEELDRVLKYVEELQETARQGYY